MGSSISPAMNVTMVVPFLSRAGGGLFDSVRRLAQEVNNLGNARVQVVGGGDQFTAIDQAAWAPIPTSALDLFGPKLFGWTPKLNHALLQQEPNVVHQHGLWSLNALEVLRFMGNTRAASRGRPAVLVVSTHGMADRWALNHAKAKKSLAWRAYQRRHLQSAACIIVTSPSEGETLRYQGVSTPIVVIPNGVDSPTPRTGNAPWTSALPRDRKVLLFLGRLHRKKGLRELLRAWANAITTDARLSTGWSLVCTGWDDDGHELEVRTLAMELGLREPHFCLTGPVYGSDRDLALTHASALVLPSWSEGMPMSVLEGMAFGLPVLISEACHLPEVLAHNAGVLANPTPNSLRMALETLSCWTDAEREAVGSAGQDLARTLFAWPTAARSTQQVYDWSHQPDSDRPNLRWL
jgi:glycosyltransferase involved in cell wall biosynthesis